MKEVKNRPLQKLNDTLPEVQNKNSQPEEIRTQKTLLTGGGGGRGRGRGQVGVGLVGDRGVFG